MFIFVTIAYILIIITYILAGFTVAGLTALISVQSTQVLLHKLFPKYNDTRIKYRLKLVKSVIKHAFDFYLKVTRRKDLLDSLFGQFAALFFYAVLMAGLVFLGKIFNAVPG